MEKLSVKKPFTILVAVIMILVLGFVSVTRMTMDLMPEISLPYMIVVTTYPGASPEKVESSVAKPMESGLGTVSGVQNLYSICSENYVLTELEFEDGTNMDSAMVKVSSAVQEVAATLPEGCGTPSIMEMSPNMMATMYVAVSREGSDIYALSDEANETIVPYLERQSGVASVNGIGLVGQSIQVDLNADKIDAVNDRILSMVNDKLDDARAKLETAQKQVADGQAQLKASQAAFGKTMASQLFNQVDAPVTEQAQKLQGQVDDLITALKDLRERVANADLNGEIDGLISRLQDIRNTLGKAGNTTDLLPTISDLEVVMGSVQTLLGHVEEVSSAWTDLAVTVRSAISALRGGISAIGGIPASISSIRERISNLISALQALERSVENSQLASQLSTIVAKLQKALKELDGVTGDLANNMPDLQQPLSDLQSLLGTIRDGDVSGTLDGQLNGASDALTSLSLALNSAPEILDGLESAYAGLTQAQLDAAVGYSTALTQLSQAESQMQSAWDEYQTQRETALKNANLDSLLTTSTLSQLIYAQNFSMPAGYIDNADDESWLLKVGDEYQSAEEISEALLTSMDGVGDIHLSDVADVTIIDNAEDSYAKLNGQDAIVLCIYKGSTAGTNEVSRTCLDAFSQLEAQNEDLHVVTLMDQGDYISLIVNSVLSSMVLGAFLAILVLALFLRDIRPTLVVGFSIPLSVLFAIVLMYFTGLTLNMMTLSGLALGIGMLVDNSIVVLENIYRLRGRGIGAPRAAVQGTRQVTGSIVASTLTTVCVFLPMIFTTGTVRELLVPMGLSITYCLMASLIVSMTVVPATCSTLLRRSQPKAHPFFDKVQDRYGKSLKWCLHHKIVPLGVAIFLLVLCIWQVVRMGIVVIPEMTADSISVTITTPEGDDKQTSYQLADQVMERILAVDGVQDVGTMDTASSMSLFSAMGTGDTSFGSYTCYVSPQEGAGSAEIQRICKDIGTATADLDCTVEATAGGMSDLSAMTSSGLSISVSGADLETLQSLSQDVVDMVEDVPGFENASNGQEDGGEVIHLTIDKDKLASYGLTVAQVYADIAARLTTSTASTTITSNGVDMAVKVSDTTDPLTLENLMDMEFTGTAMGETGQTTGETHKLSEFAISERSQGLSTINRENQTRYLSVTADTAEGYNTTLLSRTLQTKIDDYKNSGKLPAGYTVTIEGESSQVNEMVSQMGLLIALALLFIYLVMVAQFQSLLSPFIVLFTIPLAFTGGLLGLIVAGQQLSMLSLMGFLVLMGTVVNNGIVFVDYTNQLRRGGMERRDALIATGKTRMRPILMTALTTILAMAQLIFGDDMGSQLGGGMAIVIAGGLLYATLMTLFIVPIMYDIFFRRAPLAVDIGEENIDDAPDDAAEFIAKARAEMLAAPAAQPEKKPR